MFLDSQVSDEDLTLEHLDFRASGNEFYLLVTRRNSRGWRKNRRIYRLISVLNPANENSEPTRFGESVKTDSEVCDMMFGPNDIVLMIVIS